MSLHADLILELDRKVNWNLDPNLENSDLLNTLKYLLRLYQDDYFQKEDKVTISKLHRILTNLDLGHFAKSPQDMYNKNNFAKIAYRLMDKLESKYGKGLPSHVSHVSKIHKKSDKKYFASTSQLIPGQVHCAESSRDKPVVVIPKGNEIPRTPPKALLASNSTVTSSSMNKFTRPKNMNHTNKYNRPTNSGKIKSASSTPVLSDITNTHRHTGQVIGNVIPIGKQIPRTPDNKENCIKASPSIVPLQNTKRPLQQKTQIHSSNVSNKPVEMKSPCIKKFEEKYPTAIAPLCPSSALDNSNLTDDDKQEDCSSKAMRRSTFTPNDFLVHKHTSPGVDMNEAENEETKLKRVGTFTKRLQSKANRRTFTQDQLENSSQLIANESRMTLNKKLETQSNENQMSISNDELEYPTNMQPKESRQTFTKEDMTANERRKTFTEQPHRSLSGEEFKGPARVPSKESRQTFTKEELTNSISFSGDEVKDPMSSQIFTEDQMGKGFIEDELASSVNVKSNETQPSSSRTGLTCSTVQIVFDEDLVEQTKTICEQPLCATENSTEKSSLLDVKLWTDSPEKPSTPTVRRRSTFTLPCSSFKNRRTFTLAKDSVSSTPDSKLNLGDDSQDSLIFTPLENKRHTVLGDENTPKHGHGILVSTSATSEKDSDSSLSKPPSEKKKKKKFKIYERKKGSIKNKKEESLWSKLIKSTKSSAASTTLDSSVEYDPVTVPASADFDFGTCRTSIEGTSQVSTETGRLLRTRASRISEIRVVKSDADAEETKSDATPKKKKGKRLSKKSKSSTAKTIESKGKVLKTISVLPDKSKNVKSEKAKKNAKSTNDIVKSNETSQKVTITTPQKDSGRRSLLPTPMSNLKSRMTRSSTTVKAASETPPPPKKIFGRKKTTEKLQELGEQSKAKVTEKKQSKKMKKIAEEGEQEVRVTRSRAKMQQT